MGLRKGKIVQPGRGHPRRNVPPAAPRRSAMTSECLPTPLLVRPPFSAPRHAHRSPPHTHSTATPGFQETLAAPHFLRHVRHSLAVFGFTCGAGIIGRARIERNSMLAFSMRVAQE